MPAPWASQLGSSLLAGLELLIRVTRLILGFVFHRFTRLSVVSLSTERRWEVEDARRESFITYKIESIYISISIVTAPLFLDSRNSEAFVCLGKTFALKRAL